MEVEPSKCRFFSGEMILKCAINPHIPCNECREFESIIESQIIEPYVDYLTFSPDGQTLATINRSNEIKLWDTKGVLKEVINTPLPPTSIAFSPNGKILAFANLTYPSIKLWDLINQEEIGTLDGHLNRIDCLAFSPDGQILASGSWDEDIKLWDVATQKEIDILVGHSWAINSLAFSPDGKILASGSGDYDVKLWSIPEGLLIKTLTGHEDYVFSVRFSPDGKTLVSGSADESVRVWDVATQEKILIIREKTMVYSVDFSPDGKTLAVGSDKKINLWNLNTQRKIKTLEDRLWSWNVCVSFSPCGKILASAGEDQVTLWQVSGY